MKKYSVAIIFPVEAKLITKRIRPQYDIFIIGVIILSKAIIIDNGTELSKCGYSGEEKPSFVFPTRIGYPKHSFLEKNSETKIQDYYIGNDIRKNQKMLKIIHPVEHGIINDWKAMEKIWRYIFFEKLNVNPKDYPILLTEPPLNTNNNRKKITEIMFETFKVPKLFIAMQSLLPLIAAKKTTGLVVDSGAGVTHIVPIIDGKPITHAIERIDLAGHHITQHLQHLLSKKGHKFSTSVQKEFVKEMKEKYCYIANDSEKELERFEKGEASTIEFKLPDGEVVLLESERFLAPELIFFPHYYESELMALDEAIEYVINQCDVDNQAMFYENIILSGGTTKLPGFYERLYKELSELVPKTISVKISAPVNREHSVWIGGSLLSDLNNYQKKWITKKQYFDCGADIIHGQI